MLSLGHIVNAAVFEKGSELFNTQPITFETMRRAKEFAGNQLMVDLFTAQFPEDHAITPSFFSKTPDLTVSVSKLGKFRNNRKLPLINDILERLYHATPAEYLIYSNIDICLMPQFYLEVKNFIEQGYDGFMINRRGIPGHYTRADELPAMYEETGKAHPGFDCFVFHRSLYRKFILGNICIGVPDFEKVFALNLICFSDNFKLFDKEHLTFHIGEIIYKKWCDLDYRQFNRSEYRKILRHLNPYLDIRRFPWYDRPFFEKYRNWLMNPNFSLPFLMRLELSHLLKKRNK